MNKLIITEDEKDRILNLHLNEQSDKNSAVKFIKNLLVTNPNLFNGKKPLSLLEKPLSDFNSKNPSDKLDIPSLVKQLSINSSPFKMTTFNIQTYEPKRVTKLDYDLNNIGFTLTKNEIDNSIQGGVKLKF
jgi:hypothetical protein